jgi:hypothetical protein
MLPAVKEPAKNLDNLPDLWHDERVIVITPVCITSKQGDKYHL